MMVAVSAQAVDGYQDTKHEVAIGGGIFPNSELIDAFTDGLVSGLTLGTVRYDNEKFVGPVSAEYFYCAKPWLGVGGIFVYTHQKEDVLHDGTMQGKQKRHFFTLMPAVKFDWLRKSRFGLYSKLAVGLTVGAEKFDASAPQANDESDTSVFMNWQVSLIGIEAGSQCVRGFLELGEGEQGIVLAGVRYKF